MTAKKPDLNLKSLLPLRGLVVTLQFTQIAKPQFFHQAALSAFIRFLTGSPENYDQLIRIDTPETGRINYIPGDYYRFMMIGLQGSDEILTTLINKLQKLPLSSPKDTQALPFRNNWKLLNIQDAFSEQTIESLAQVSQYSYQQLTEEVALWNGQTEIHWHWLSPVRLLKQKQQREKLKGEDRFIRNNTDLDGNLLFSRAYNALADLIRRREGESTALASPTTIQIKQAHLFWLDSHYTNKEKKPKPMGGMTGTIKLQLPENISPVWWQILLLGQYTGIGQRSTFGWGRYQLQTLQQHYSYRRIVAANSILSQVENEENLKKAWRHVMAGHADLYEIAGEDQDIDTEDEEELTKAPIQRLQKDLDKLLQGQYKTPTLRGYLIPKKKGGVRPLAIPPIYDRILQRAISQILSPALEQLMYQHSHGYRPGRSRITARYEIQAAWRAGYHWVYESDIKHFFDSVSLKHLEDRLNAIYFGDPLVKAIINWMQAPVRFKGQTIERKNGLPQGSPLSPLMANLMLDDFDSDMQAAGFFLIRFADDFIVLCKDPEQAEKAEQAAKQSLEEHGLTLHPEKSQITALDKGFKYLGYLFINDMALDTSGSQPPEISNKAIAPPNSWLANFAEQQPQKITQEQALTQLIEKIASQSVIEISDREITGTLLTVTGEHSVVSTLNKQLQVHRKDKRLYKLPWRSLDAVVLFGNHQITTQAMHAALKHNISIHLASGTGRYKGVITHNRNSQHQTLWLKQTVSFKDEEKALYCAREIVTSRLIHIKEHLRQRKQAHNIPMIEKAITNVNRAKNLESLRGYEGSATREYYQHLSLVLPAEFEFCGRNRRPPKDPFNVMLSLGYTILYSYTESFLHTSGLLPWQGFYHQARGTHAALASDLMEPFRHLIERTAISLIKRHEIKLEDFSYNPSGSCYISDKARRKYLALILQRWEVKVKAKGQLEAQSWLKHLQSQNQSLKDFIFKGTPFKAFRLR